MVWAILAGILVIALILLDGTKKLSLTNRLFLFLFLPLLPHVVLLSRLLFVQLSRLDTSSLMRGLLLTEFLLLWLLYYLRLALYPLRASKGESRRLTVLRGGRQLVGCGLYTALCLIFYFIFSPELYAAFPDAQSVCLANGIVSALLTLSLFANGVVRILFTARRLNVLKRFFAAFWVLIPPVSFYVLWSLCRTAKQEYDYETLRAAEAKVRAESDLCRTKYPLLLLHGVGFRDMKYFNYWGRIPRELKRYGACIHYGNQEAWGTVANNGEDIKKRILEITQAAGCEKVNIIAHSKGGLDARYAVSTLNMSPYVASVTTMSTPHRGCRFVDIALRRIPDGLFRNLAVFMDRRFTAFGDIHPDFATAARQFSTEYSAMFNEKTPDAPGVYYQSYMSVMKNSFSDFILSIPHAVIRRVDGENDGLVSVDSAKWGDFKGVFRSKYRRGISHGDIIDLRRDDYRGFDVREIYVQIVTELKNMGF